LLIEEFDAMLRSQCGVFRSPGGVLSLSKYDFSESAYRYSCYSINPLRFLENCIEVPGMYRGVRCFPISLSPQPPFPLAKGKGEKTQICGSSAVFPPFYKRGDTGGIFAADHRVSVAASRYICQATPRYIFPHPVTEYELASVSRCGCGKTHIRQAQCGARRPAWKSMTGDGCIEVSGRGI
jgi:hypothetical protein